MLRDIELLAPAKNKDIGMTAILHGADAVYIGAKRFGARYAAGNSIDDIAELVEFAHAYKARVYVTVNTLVQDDEIESCYRLIDELIDIEADALLLQDMALMKYANGKIEIHASTQTDIRDAGKAKWLHSLGFSRLVLARELSLNEISLVHSLLPDVELEAFVHGALCVCYSGQCYASEHCFNRSANRGECAQMCRMSYDLLNVDNDVLISDKHLLSLKDMCRIANLEEMIDAGVTSFKIEGRLKDKSYVKNIVAAYNTRLNEIINRRKDLRRSSLGFCRYNFTPNVEKTFNRGYTTYFLKGREVDIFQPFTPKSIGEKVGFVKECRNNYILVSGTSDFANGDGICYVEDNQLKGFRINRADNNKIYPQQRLILQRGMQLYRNFDKAFEDKLQSTNSSERRIPISIRLALVKHNPESMGNQTDIDVSLEMTVLEDTSIKVNEIFKCKCEVATTPQYSNVVKQMQKLGSTPFVSENMEIDDAINSLFIQSSILASWRRSVSSKLVALIRSNRKHSIVKQLKPDAFEYTAYHKKYPYLINAANDVAIDFYNRLNGDNAKLLNKNADIKHHAVSDLLLMQCRHCLRYSLGVCKKNKNKAYDKIYQHLFGERQHKLKEPLYLSISNGMKFRLEFDCTNCQMNVYAT